MLKDRKKIQIKDVPYLYIDMYIFKGSIEEVSEKILNIKNDLKKAYETRKKQYPNEQFTLFNDYQYIELQHDIYDRDSIEVIVYRDETDQEYKKRIQEEKKRKDLAKLSAQKRKETIEKIEKTLYEKLKNKYEKNN